MNSVSFSVSKKSVDAGLLLTQNEIRAQKDLVFSVTRKVFQVEPLPDVHGYGVSLKMALVWQIRQTRLHQTTSGTLEFNLKLDGDLLQVFSLITKPIPNCLCFPVWLLRTVCTPTKQGLGTHILGVSFKISDMYHFKKLTF